MRTQKYAMQEKDEQQVKSCRAAVNKIQINKGKNPVFKLSNSNESWCFITRYDSVWFRVVISHDSAMTL